MFKIIQQKNLNTSQQNYKTPKSTCTSQNIGNNYNKQKENCNYNFQQVCIDYNFDLVTIIPICNNNLQTKK